MTKKTVLMIENQTNAQKEIKELLQKNGYQTKIAVDGAKALELWKEEKMDYVLLSREAATRSGQQLMKVWQSERLTDEEGRLVVDTGRRQVKMQGEEIQLTPTEYKLLVTLMKSPNRIFTREQLITYALDDEFGGYDRTIDTYIKELRRKLKEDGKNPHYIRTVHGVGYKFVP